MMSFESPKKDADCFQSPLIANSEDGSLVLSLVRGGEWDRCSGV